MIVASTSAAAGAVEATSIRLADSSGGSEARYWADSAWTGSGLSQGCPGVFDEEVLIERTVVMVVVANRAGVERKTFVARPGRSDVLLPFGVTGHAEVHRDGHGARSREFGAMLYMTARAVSCVDLFPVRSHPGIAEPLARVAVVGVVQRVFMAVLAGLVERFLCGLGVGECGCRVTGLACQFELMMRVGGGADEEGPAVAADDHQDHNDSHGDQRAHRGQDRDDGVSGHARAPLIEVHDEHVNDQQRRQCAQRDDMHPHRKAGQLSDLGKP